MQRTVCVHIGTHKTGTKALQTFLYMNRLPLLKAGVLVPRSGRLPLGDNTSTPGHHVVAWELRAQAVSRALSEVLDEIVSAAPRVAILSSEEFQYLHRFPESLHALRDGFASIGYAVAIVVYLRAQPFYAESVYGEYVKSGNFPDFEAYIDAILRDGSYTPPHSALTLQLEYGKLLEPFAAVFGRDNVIVRRYPCGAAPDSLFLDFSRLIAKYAGAFNLHDLVEVPVTNESPSFLELLGYVYRAAARRGTSGRSPAELIADSPLARTGAAQERFRLLDREAVLRFLPRFADGNRRTSEAFGTVIPFTSEADVPPAGEPPWRNAGAERALLARAAGEWNLSASGKQP